MQRARRSFTIRNIATGWPRMEFQWRIEIGHRTGGRIGKPSENWSAERREISSRYGWIWKQVGFNGLREAEVQEKPLGGDYDNNQQIMPHFRNRIVTI